MGATVVQQKSGQGWTMYNGDCCEVLSGLPSNSIHYSVFSPPFSSLYTYTNSERDMGNCRGEAEFFEHFDYLVQELYRVLLPGRLVSFHCMNLPSSKERHGVIGLKDFRGDLIRAFQKRGWIYHSEVCIWKNPVTAMQRTKALGLLHKQIKKDSCMSRQGIADYVVTMRKPGDNPERVTHTQESFPVDAWQRFASPVWASVRKEPWGGFEDCCDPSKDNPDGAGVRPGHTLQKIREENDERHICPLQLDVIERCVELWSNPGDVVLSPFAGIGSEGYVSIQKGRRFVGVELKGVYFEQACKNLERIKDEREATRE